MAQWGGTAMLILTGLAILAAWGWLWIGATRRTRALTLERLYPWSPTAVIKEAQAFIWPAFPVLGLAWIGAGDLTARVALGRSWGPSASLLGLLFALLALLVLFTATGHSLPRWCYPGWRAERYYRRCPERAEAELRSRAASRFVSVRAA